MLARPLAGLKETIYSLMDLREILLGAIDATWSSSPLSMTPPVDSAILRGCANRSARTIERVLRQFCQLRGARRLGDAFL